MKYNGLKLKNYLKLFLVNLLISLYLFEFYKTLFKIISGPYQNNIKKCFSFLFEDVRIVPDYNFSISFIRIISYIIENKRSNCRKILNFSILSRVRSRPRVDPKSWVVTQVAGRPMWSTQKYGSTRGSTQF